MDPLASLFISPTFLPYLDLPHHLPAHPPQLWKTPSSQSVAISPSSCFHQIPVRQSRIYLLEHSPTWILLLTNLSISSCSCRPDLFSPAFPWPRIQRCLSRFHFCQNKILFFFIHWILLLSPTFVLAVTLWQYVAPVFTFSIDGASPDVQVASSIATNAPPHPSETQAYKLSTDNKMDSPSPL